MRGVWHQKPSKPKKGTQRFSKERKARTKKALLKKYGPVCQKCKGPIDLTLIDHPMQFTIGHKVAWAQGGSNKLENLQPEHRKCNEEDARRPQKGQRW